MGYLEAKADADGLKLSQWVRKILLAGLPKSDK